MFQGLLGGLSDAVNGSTPDAVYTLHLSYEMLQAEADPDVLLPRVSTLLERLAFTGHLRDLHNDDGEYTWYKLSEWYVPIASHSVVCH